MDRRSSQGHIRRMVSVVVVVLVAVLVVVLVVVIAEVVVLTINTPKKNFVYPSERAKLYLSRIKKVV